ncbi:MAG: hypothetical protein HFE68_06345 [Erysipelotrichaceae bacterium]|nr:hypothetical protein [Erysipelotrichaceae bacterium]MCI9312967.1 hypothetical protein [Erysipelotrichaceae bacterium]
MFIILFAAAVGGVMVWTKYREAVKCKQAVENAVTNRKFEVYDYSKVMRVLYILFICFGIASAVFGIYQQNDETVAMGIIIALLFISELVMLPYRYKLYYNNSQFIVKGEVLRLKSIKYFERILNLKFAFVKVIMLNGDKYPVSPKAYAILDQKLSEVRQKPIR